ncbi:tetratricopeptide repeat-containing sensor histidine kinase [Pedobacter endophyticus]|uniref:histidine kinase n=1 Tax=Pedobacter endophyticus TaxID=2789740 RepID=A0A7S9PZV0_9SPHI|nr:tetratricopeptide repeat protein [Pedobacter endophyticus]QPH40733.1 tetratricopeptide repeat protein [Pedobacter endophyticus]
MGKLTARVRPKFNYAIIVWSGIVFSLFFPQLTCGQHTNLPQHKLDSLLKVNDDYVKQDTNKGNVLGAIYRQYILLKKPEMADFYIEKSIQLGRDKSLKRYSGLAYSRRGRMYHAKAEYANAEANYLKAISEFSAVGDLNNVAGNYLNLSALYASIPDYIKSLEVSQKAIAIYEKIGNETDLANCYTNVSITYRNLGNRSRALTYMKRALEIFTKDEDKRGIAVVCELIGTNYFEATTRELMEMNVLPDQKINLALTYYNKALTLVADTDDEIVADIKIDLGNVYAAVGKYELALKSYQRAVEINRDNQNKDAYGTSLYALGNFYQKINDFSNAMTLLNQSLKLATTHGFLELERNSALGLSIVYEKQGDYSNSLTFFKHYIAARDKIFNREKEREITRTQMQLDFDFKEKDYLLHQKITEGELQRQQQELILRKQQLTLSGKEKLLDQLTFQKAKAEFSLQRSLQASKYASQNFKSQIAANEKDRRITQQEQQIKFDQRVKIFLTVAATLILMIAIVIFYNQRKTTRLNKIINLQKRELEQLSRVKDRIFSVVSHDMRTPVNSLISFIQLLEGGKIEQEKLTKYAASLKNNLTHTSTMMENLLTWAASQMQGFNPYLELIDVCELVTDVIASVSDLAEQKQILIKNQVSEGTLCKADRNMLMLAIRNLINNSIKFTPSGGTIHISSKGIDNVLEIKISDTGIGLTEDQVNHFNKPGYSGAGVSSPGTNKEKGTGLGLLLCRTFIELMDGEITAHLNNDTGSHFKILLKK